MEEVLSRHRKEQRDLQSRITQQKKAASKKTRKTVNAECEVLERQLKERQARETAELSGEQAANGDDEEEADLEDDDDLQDQITLKEPTLQPTPADTLSTSYASSPALTRKPNRQKARLARRAQEQEAQVAQAEAEAANIPDLREKERESMQRSLEKHGLVLKEIRPDGHCLYSAVADQLERKGIPLRPGTPTGNDGNGDNGSAEAYRRVRRAAADFMISHPDDFEAFLEEPLPDHVRKVAETAEWGGQLELLALARAYGLQINVLQGDGRIEKIEPGEGFVGEQQKHEVWLGYYRHVYGLGEHYNSLRQRD